MDVIIILILTSLGVAAAFLGGFIWAVKSGQYEDTSTPALRVLTEESGSAPAAGAANRALAVGSETRTIPARANLLARSDAFSEETKHNPRDACASRPDLTEKPSPGKVASQLLDSSNSNKP